jgi:hypothetical protein
VLNGLNGRAGKRFTIVLYKGSASGFSGVFYMIRVNIIEEKRHFDGFNESGHYKA